MPLAARGLLREFHGTCRRVCETFKRAQRARSTTILWVAALAVCHQRVQGPRVVTKSNDLAGWIAVKEAEAAENRVQPSLLAMTTLTGKVEL